MNRATASYNMIPENLRKIGKLETFKKELKLWTWKNLAI